MKYLTSSIFILALLSCQNKKEYYEKQVTFPQEATLEQKVDMASRLVPTKQQLDWQKLELTAFLHFGINTFTGREWGDGKEDPQLFNPTAFDADQWVNTLKQAGFKMAIITAKHHDGFCLWPSQTTQHSVASSPWKNGKGDVVQELHDACRKYNIGFGVYLSPWDRNASCYGDSPKYNDFFIAQLTELLTQYGKVDEVWFDGANGEGPNGKKQVYDWARIRETITKLQPDAVTAIMGDDVRWVGNERGLGRETEWSATVITPEIAPNASASNKDLGVNFLSKDLGSRDILAKAKDLHWFPSEVDVSIRPGWFFHEDQNHQVKSLSHLVDIYYKSVGLNSVLLLNIPPDTRGLIHEADVDRLGEFAQYIENTFKKNYVIDGKYWVAGSREQKVYEIESGKTINTILLQEDIAKGQRVESFTIESKLNGQWKKITEGTTIGYKRLVKFDDLKTDEIRLTINSSRNQANILNVGAYYAKPIESNPELLVLNESDASSWNIKGSKNSTYKNMIDGNPSTYYQQASFFDLEIDLGKSQKLGGFIYTPVMRGDKKGTISKYEVLLSNNGSKWIKAISNGEFSNIKNNPIPQRVLFKTPATARYIKLVPKEEIDGHQAMSVADFGIIASKTN